MLLFLRLSASITLLVFLISLRTSSTACSDISVKAFIQPSLTTLKSTSLSSVNPSTIISVISLTTSSDIIASVKSNSVVVESSEPLISSLFSSIASSITSSITEPKSIFLIRSLKLSPLKTVVFNVIPKHVPISTNVNIEVSKNPKNALPAPLRIYLFLLIYT